jgi:hypothetical protein
MTRTRTENTDFQWRRLLFKVQEAKIKEAFETFRTAGIEPILIKGWAAARFYPEKSDRLFADIDLCVAPEVFADAKSLLQNETIARLNIDLHDGLRHLDTLNWVDLFKNSQLVKLDLAKIRVLCPEDHLRVLSTHWLNDGGAYKEKLRDIYYLIEYASENFDWEKCLSVVSKTRQRWILCVLGVTKKYFQLSLKRTPIEAETENLPDWFIETIEKEWKSTVKLKPLQNCLGNKKEFIQQIKKRVPPNPVQATVEQEGSFDKHPRIYYQIMNIFSRIIPSIRRINRALSRKEK